MKNWFFRLCSTILVLALLVNMLPMSIFAEEFKEQLTMQDNVSLEKIEAEKAYVVAEITDKRGENIKEFLLSNGLHIATVYAEPVHYEKDGKWEEIDNTLVAKSDGTFRNTAGVWNVSFPNQLSRSNSISIEKDGYTLSFSMAGELRSSGELMTAVMGTEATEQLAVSQMQAATASVQQIDTAALAQSYRYAEAVPNKLYSQLRYNSVYANTDVVYDLQSNTVKESIILDTYSSTLRGYRYTLNVGQLIPVMDEYNDITFYAPDGKTVVMVMPAPYLLDANNEYNDDIQVQLTGKDGTYTLTYLLPQQWLAEEDRAWPVILDPVITASHGELPIDDITVCEKETVSPTKTTIDAGYSAKRGIIRAYLKYTRLPALTSSDVVVEADITLTKPQTNSVSKTVEIHKVLDPWDIKTIGWANQPLFKEEISDFTYVKNSGDYTWQITEIVRSWYTKANNGLMLKMSNDVEDGGSDYFRQFYSSETGVSNRPVLEITFKNNNGLESDWDYTSTSAGRAGIGSVNNFTGNLVWIRDDMGFSGNRMPVTIQHIYNANDAIVLPNDNNNSNNSGGNYFGLGIGWRINFHERVFPWEYGDPEDNSTTNYYIWEDGDGTDHYFKSSGTNTYKHEQDNKLILNTNGSGAQKYSITDSKDNVRYFDESGRLTKIKNNQATPSSIDITYVPGTTYEIDYITDGAGRKYDFTYASGLLSKIEFKGLGTTVLQSTTFTYENGQLNAITDHDGKVSNYTYNSDGIFTNIKDFDNYEVSYEYTLTETTSTPSEDETATNDTSETEGGNPPPWKPPYLVDKVSAKHGNADGGWIKFEYSYNETRMTDHNDNVQIMQFNDYGRTVNVMDDEGHAQFLDYAANSHTDTGKANQLTFSSKLQNTVANLLNHSSFETGNPWTAASGSTATVNTEQENSHYGTKSLLVKGTVLGPAFTIPDGQTYTLSVYVKASDSANIGFKVNGATVSHTAIPVGTDFVRYEVSYSNDTGNAVQATPFLFAGDVNGAYFDCAQLENMPTASRYNLIENGDFRYTGTDGVWTKYSNCTANDKYTTLDDPNPVAPQLGDTVFSITGNRTKTKNIKQTVQVSGSEGESFVLAGWVKGYAVPQGTFDGDTRKFALRARFEYSDGSSSDYFYAHFRPTIDGWQYSTAAMVAPEDYVGITVVLVYNYNVNTILIDGIQLFKEEFGASYTYDDKGNLVTSVDLQKKTTTYEYDGNGNLLQILEDNIAKVTYDYYENTHNVETATTGEGIVYSFVYDEFGNNTKVTIGDGENKITSEAHYNESDEDTPQDTGNYLEYTVDALGNITNYGYDPDTNTLEWVQYPNDTENTRTEYGYDDMFRKASEVCTTDEGANMSVNYTYENDYLMSVATPTTTYGFTYGDFGLRESVTVGSNTLATYTYDEDYYPKRLDYGNGDHVEYKYEDGRKLEETYKGGDTVEYQYNNDGDLARIKDSATGRTTTQFYDLLGRPMKYEVTGDDYYHSVTYGYNADNNLTAQVEVLNGVTTTTTYEYDDDNRISWSQTGDTKVVYTYDDYGRVETKVTNVSNTPFKTESFTYVTITADDNDPDTEPTTITSSQVETHTVAYGNTSIVYAYTYDDNGNILTVSETTATNDADESTRTSSYVYDSANQLLRENNEEGGYTKTWTYDNAGNITSRNKYAHTTAEDLTGLTSTGGGSYVYGDDVWGDKLTSYNGRTIAYDNIGNPTSIEATEDGYERTYTWEHGRQLKTLYDGVDNWTFEYDANGMRTRRYCDWCGYQYTYTGSQLTQMKFEGSTLNFTYDASGTPLTMSIDGTVYYYVTNLQGDVVKLLDSAGNTVAAYSYDAWGVCTGQTLSFVELYNPLRYRGYVYDVDFK